MRIGRDYDTPPHPPEAARAGSPRPYNPAPPEGPSEAIAPADRVPHGRDRPPGVRDRAAVTPPIRRPARGQPPRARPALRLVLGHAVPLRPAVGARVRPCGPAAGAADR